MTVQIYEYPAVFYYEKHPLIIDLFSVQVCFPDFKRKGFISTVSGRNRVEALACAQELLESMVEHFIHDNKTIPDASEMEKVNLDRGINICEAAPFRIEIENIIYEK
ncbi:type II toxin-antitoxin system HicB family antitoxin [Peribacillus sp. NPDC096540]|uniref:type II toxin-antitoxin system HicB family antitoxin n=1 Tax=Peribacillus sp. NPDC096540 TaxID=3390612 RepID=UPI003D018787